MAFRGGEQGDGHGTSPSGTEQPPLNPAGVVQEFAHAPVRGTRCGRIRSGGRAPCWLVPPVDPIFLLMRSFLILQLRPEDAASDSEFEAFLEYGGLHHSKVVRIRLDREPFPEPGLDRFLGTIVGGSPFEVSTPESDKGEQQRRIEAGFATLLEEIVGADLPFLGACSGCGLLGAHCGASLSGRHSEPVGGTDVTLTPAGREDPLFEGLPDRFRALVGHKEACDHLPDGAVLLATSERCPVQMFRIKNNVYATQFHPEADPEGFIVRIETYRSHGYFPAEQADELIRAVSKEDTPVPRAMLARFVSRYRT